MTHERYSPLYLSATVLWIGLAGIAFLGGHIAFSVVSTVIAAAYLWLLLVHPAEVSLHG